MPGRRQRRQHGRPQAARIDALAHLGRGDRAIIAEIPDDRARAQAMRFGMGVGAPVECISSLTGGPIIIRSGRQEIAIGRGLARRIRVNRHTEALYECA